MTVYFTRTDSGGVHIATRTATETEAETLIAALLRLPHIATAYIRES